MEIDIITELNKLNLIDYPTEEITKILNSIGPMALMTTDYRPPKVIERAVNNTKEEPEFNTTSRISYKPAKFNTEFQRASTPNNTMFYGAVLSEKMSDEEITNARIIGACEVTELIRNRELKNGESDITFGKWIVRDKISLATIFDPSLDYKIDYINEIKENYLLNLNSAPKDIKEKSLRYLKFLATEFSKPVKKGENHEYLISAILTEILVNTGFDGVLYPSVQTSGMGLCVAIHPRLMDKLSLFRAIQCKIIKTDGDIKITNEKVCEIELDATEFKLNLIK